VSRMQGDSRRREGRDEMIDLVGVSADIYRSVYTPLVLGFWFLLSFADAARLMGKMVFCTTIRALLDAYDMQSYVLGQRAVHAP
jgi:hypothetical protein